MVENLELVSKKYPHPYKLQWLNQGNEVKVTRQVIVPFSIGSVYQDEITCDVIAMELCHLLLGRPWLFDKYVYHNGHQNTYSLYLNGKKITLTSLKPSEIPRADPTAKNDKTLFMTQAEVDTELNGGTGAYLLLLVESDELNQHDDVPARVKPLLSEFADVFLMCEIRYINYRWKTLVKKTVTH
ncbi:uncharacterized protein [Rutidosis leptorrhynchoides]|uniref:uncharacterized protein n=1 Tax=Rutidosis leptorrhynchoides TaxID=125765 RepID=UPI003A995FEC